MGVSTQPIPVKPPALARVSHTAADLVTAADTNAEHATACADLIAQIGGVYNAGPFTPWRHKAEGAAPGVTVGFPGGLGGANWGGIAFDPNSRFIFVATQDVGALGSVEKTKEDRRSATTRQLRGEAHSTSEWATRTGRVRSHRGVV